ncbi:hypothetical protein Tco_0622692 [Tanacetum coccineum]
MFPWPLPSLATPTELLMCRTDNADVMFLIHCTFFMQYELPFYYPGQICVGKLTTLHLYQGAFVDIGKVPA